MPEMNNFKFGNDTYEVADAKSRGVSLTWAQYQALSYEQQHNGTAYYITDMDAIYPVDHELNANSRNAVANDVVTPHILAQENVLGAKNLLPYPYSETTKTSNGVIFTDNGDGSVTIDSSDKDETLINPYMNIFGGFAYSPNRLVSDLFKTPGTYIISMKNTRLQGFLTFTIENYMDVEIHEEDLTVTITDSMMNSRVAVLLWCSEKRNTPITIKPMIRPAGTDPTYVPYSMTNRELTEKAISKSVTVTPESGYLLNFNHLRVVNNMLYGSIGLFNQVSDLPTRTWTTIATCDLRPSDDIQTSLFSAAEGISGGLMIITQSGEIQVFQSYYDPVGGVTKKGAAGVFSHPL